MYKNIVTVSKEEIMNLPISAKEKYDWVDTVLKNKKEYVLPVKTRIPLKTNDYFNVMPSVLPPENVLGLKVVTRSENRRNAGESNIDGDILLYSYEDFLPLALMDGSYITTIRTAAVAVHAMLNFTPKEILKSDNLQIAMLGLGNIGTEICSQLFELLSDYPFYTVKLYHYKDHAERTIEKFKSYSNIKFEVCDSYEDLMHDSDVVFSSVTYAETDFCAPEVYKDKCVIIPVHLRGFKQCDCVFDQVITSDLESIKKFEYYNEMKRLDYIDELMESRRGGVFLDVPNRRIIYNLGLAVYDIYFALEIYRKIYDK